MKFRRQLKGVRKKRKKNNEKFLEFYCHMIYRYIGRYLLQNKKFKFFFDKNIYNIRYEGILKKANLKLMPN
ncbi:MAG: hypothetical protein ACOCRX_12205, partial [Candidatus Woesearchaeota archaeon]